MDESKNIIELLKNNKSAFTEEELKKIIDNELSKNEDERNEELLFLCLNTLNNTEAPPPENKRKIPWKPLLFIAVAALLLLLNATVLPGLKSSFAKTTSAVNTSASQFTETEVTTQTTTFFTDVYINFLYKPEKIIFYHNAKPQTLSEEMSTEIIKEINNVTKRSTWDVLKLAVTKEHTEKIKNENLCIEIYYDGIQLLNDLNGENVKDNTYRFEKILIVLDGDDKNTFFFEKDGEYQNGPIVPCLSDLSEKILQEIFDENSTPH